MDPFSLALGVLTVVQTAGQAAESLYKFAKDIHDAQDEIQSLSREANSLYGVLRRINEALKEPKVAAYIGKNPAVEGDLASLKEPLQHCEKRIGELMILLERLTERDTSGGRKVKSYRWPFDKKEVIAARNELAQTRDVATFAFSGLDYVERLRQNAEPRPLRDQLAELEGQSASLRKAACDGDNRVIPLLLDAAVPVDSKDGEGRTALSYAAQHGNVDTIKLLLQNRAFVNSAADVIKEGSWFKKAEGKRTPLHWAAVGGHILSAAALLDAGANIEAMTQSQQTPATTAAVADHLKTVRFLLERGADVTAHTYYGWSMLHTAAANGKLELAELLLSRNADVEAVYRGAWHGEGNDVNNGTHQHPLHYAVRPKRKPSSSETAMIELLLQTGHANVSAQDSVGSTPVHYAVRSGWAKAVEVLVKHVTVADIATKDASGKTALDDANNSGDRDIIDMIRSSQNTGITSRRSPMRSEETFP